MAENTEKKKPIILSIYDYDNLLTDIDTYLPSKQTNTPINNTDNTDNTDNDNISTNSTLLPNFKIFDTIADTSSNLIVLPTKINIESISNIKNLHLYNEDLMLQYRIICDKIINCLESVNDIQYLKFRDILYDIFIYNLDITDCIWYILSSLIEKKKIKKEQMSSILIKTYSFFQYYNNNYRPIYHVENYLLNIAKLIHNF